MHKLAMSVALLLALACPGRSRADLITLTESITTDGSLGGTAFTGKLVTLTLVVDTSSVVFSQGSGFHQYAAPATSATVAVAGLGTASFTDSLGVVVQSFTTFSDFLVTDPTNPDDVLDTYATAPGFAGVDLTSSFGPVGGGAAFSVNHAFSTSLGDLVFTHSGGGTSSVSGFVSTVPEPSAFTMLGIGCLGLLWARRRGDRRGA